MEAPGRLSNYKSERTEKQVAQNFLEDLWNQHRRPADASGTRISFLIANKCSKRYSNRQTEKSEQMLKTIDSNQQTKAAKKKKKRRNRRMARGRKNRRWQQVGDGGVAIGEISLRPVFYRPERWTPNPNCHGPDGRGPGGAQRSTWPMGLVWSRSVVVATARVQISLSLFTNLYYN